jgi:hypothetical protein
MRNEGDYLRGLWVHAEQAEAAAHKVVRGVVRARSHLSAVRALVGVHGDSGCPLLVPAEAAADAALAAATAWDAAVVAARGLVGGGAAEASALLASDDEGGEGGVSREVGGLPPREPASEGCTQALEALGAALGAGACLEAPASLHAAAAEALRVARKAQARVRDQEEVVAGLGLQATDLAALGTANFRVCTIARGVADAVRSVPPPDLRPWVRAVRALAEAL